MRKSSTSNDLRRWSGSIDFTEFAELISSFNRERYTKVFESFDVDGIGELVAPLPAASW